MKSRKSLWLVGATLLAVILSSCNLGATAVPTEDPGLIQTQAVSVVMTEAALQQTQTAMAIPPTAQPTNTSLPTPTLGEIATLAIPTFQASGSSTNTPDPFNTQQPGLTPLSSLVPTVGVVVTFTTKNGCNDGSFQGETSPFDKDVVGAEKKYDKSWTILNTGTCTWDEGYSLAFLPELSSAELGGYSIVLKKNAAEEYTKPGHTQSFIVKLVAPKAAGEYKGYWKMKDDAGNLFGPLISVWITVK